MMKCKVLAIQFSHYANHPGGMEKGALKGPYLYDGSVGVGFYMEESYKRNRRRAYYLLRDLNAEGTELQIKTILINNYLFCRRNHLYKGVEMLFERYAILFGKSINRELSLVDMESDKEFYERLGITHD